MENRPSPLKFIALAAGALAMAGAGLWWFKVHDYNVRQSIDAGVVVLRDGGPWVFFSAFALLPAVGFPVSFFYLTAGPAFAGKMGMPNVLAATGVALLVNNALAYWIARCALRPWLESWISRTKYRIPRVKEGEHAEITLIVRLTPGPPYFMQSYLLGLAEVDFGKYLVISWVISVAYASGLIVFGDAILHGEAGLAVMGISVLLVVFLLVHLLRKHYGKKRA